MNVYTCKFTSAYGFCVGFLIVAANSEEEACHTAMRCKQGWLYYESIVGSGVEANSISRVAESRHLPMVSAKPQPPKADNGD